MEAYYERREAAPGRPEPLARGWDGPPPPVDPDTGLSETRLVVDGLRCASCVWVTENVVARAPGVASAHVSYATGIATIAFDPERTTLADIGERIASLGYRPRALGTAATPDRDLLARLGVASFAAANVMLMSAALYAGWIDPMEARFTELFRWLSLVLATPVALWCAAPFFAGAMQGARAGRLHMDVPIAVAVAVLYAHGLAATVVGFDGYLDSLTMLVALLLGGRFIETRGRTRAAEAATTLAATVPATARRVTTVAGGASTDPDADAGLDRPVSDGTSVETVRSDELSPGDVVLVGAGEELPADGVVRDGSGSLQVALITGEAAPSPVGVGDPVWAGTVLTDGALSVAVTAVAAESVVGRMAEELREAMTREARSTPSDRIAPWFTAATLSIASATFTGWLVASGLAAALSTSVAVLVVACPCALALSRPLAGAAGLAAAARRGLLMRSMDALLDLATVDTAVLDKTGTVTEGAQEVLAASDADLRVAASLERYSRHPAALAIVREAVTRGIALPEAHQVREAPGEGISGVVDGTTWRLSSGGPGVLALESRHGHVGAIRLGDRVRHDSRHAIARLRTTGLEVALLTGDHVGPARAVAAETGVTDVAASVTADRKPDAIRALQRDGHRVLFVGDGLNDGTAIAAADVGIAMGSGAAPSLLAADGLLAVGSLSPLAAGVVAARASRQAVRANQVRSIAYNVLAVSAAAAGWVNPLIAAVLMPLSSAMVLIASGRVEAGVRRWEARS